MISRITIAFIPLALGIILHEVAHGLAASYCGDDTAKKLGRLTINPIVHIDPTGLFCFIITAIASPFIFGWAKPVPVNIRNFTRIKNVKTAMLIISLAGPLSNFLLACVFTLLLKIFLYASPSFLASSTGYFLQNMLFMGIGINLILMIVNLIPLPPLDGSHIITRILPYPYDYKYMSLARYGMFILLILMLTGFLSGIVQFFLQITLPFLLAFI